MSSAILYLGIVVIWACVLIPRWLRRDSAASASHEESWDEPVEWEADSGSGSGSDSDEEAPTVEEAPVPVPAPASRDEARKKVLAARRRMLGMLSALVLGAVVLAFTKLAAWWVIVPPTIMMSGYLILLREAAHADAERAAAEARDVAAREAATAHEAAAARETAPRETAAREAERPRVVEVPPDAEVIDISSQVGEEFYDQYTDARLRAVGD